MTKLLYLDDSYLLECDAEVLSCEAHEGGGYDVVLDQTVLYPAGGGQPYDTGSIGETRVLDVSESGDAVVHHTDAALTPGQRVRVQVDWQRRFDHMQQHCGEHILSFAAKELFCAVNVGFHMAESYSTLDLNMPLEPEQLDHLEARANALVWANLPVRIQYVTAEQLEEMELRKKAEGLSGSIRIISMPGGDSCTCCGTHVGRTGEIGSIKIASAEHYKGGERLSFLCGGRALLYAQSLHLILTAQARKYSCKIEDVPAALNKQQQELSAARRENRELYARLLGYIKQELLAGAEPVGKARLCVAMVEMPPAQLKPLAQSLCGGAKGAPSPTLALLLARNGETMQYVLCCSEGMPQDMGELAQAVNAALNAKGGGRGTLAQGSAKYTPGAKEALGQLKGYLLQVLKSNK